MHDRVGCLCRNGLWVGLQVRMERIVHGVKMLCLVRWIGLFYNLCPFTRPLLEASSLETSGGSRLNAHQNMTASHRRVTALQGRMVWSGLILL